MGTRNQSTATVAKSLAHSNNLLTVVDGSKSCVQTVERKHVAALVASPQLTRRTGTAVLASLAAMNRTSDRGVHNTRR